MFFIMLYFIFFVDQIKWDYDYGSNQHCLSMLLLSTSGNNNGYPTLTVYSCPWLWLQANIR